MGLGWLFDESGSSGEETSAVATEPGPELDPASRDRLRCQGHEARREEARLIAAIDAVNARTAVANARAAEERRLRDAALAQLDATIAGRVAQEARTAELERRVAERYGTNHTAGG